MIVSNNFSPDEGNVVLSKNYSSSGRKHCRIQQFQQLRKRTWLYPTTAALGGGGWLYPTTQPLGRDNCYILCLQRLGKKHDCIP
jgi:hypothetical protein